MQFVEQCYKVRETGGKTNGSRRTRDHDSVSLSKGKGPDVQYNVLYT